MTVDQRSVARHRMLDIKGNENIIKPKIASYRM
jgi:hypothetical protein